MDDTVEKSTGGNTEESAALRTHKELRRCEEEILATENFTPEEALRLGGSYIAYEVDSYYILGDKYSDQDSPTVRDAWVRQRMLNEAALIKAQTGDYTGIKERLQDEGETLLKISDASRSEPELQTQGQITEKLGRKFLQMGTVLPDRGKPFTPPPPVAK